MLLLICVTILPQVTALARESGFGIVGCLSAWGKLVALGFCQFSGTPLPCLHGASEFSKGFLFPFDFFTFLHHVSVLGNAL